MIPYFLPLEKESYEDKTLVCFVQCRLCRHCHCPGQCLAGRRKTGRGWLLAASPLPGLCRPSTWSSSPGKREEEGDLPAGVGLHVYPSSALYPQYPYSQGTKTDSPGLGSPTTAPVQQPGKQCGKRIPSRSLSHKGTHKVRAAQPGDSFLYKRGWGGRTPSRLASARGQADLCLSYLLHVVTVSCQCWSSAS